MTRSARSNLVAIALSALGLAGCGRNTALHVPDGSSGASFRVSVTPLRQLDMVFMIDNSAMSPKVSKMSARLPEMIAALKDLSDSTLPDLRVAFIDSDLGTGGQYPNGPCGPKNGGAYGDQGHFQMLNDAGPTPCGVNSPEALWIEYNKGRALNYTGDISNVLACLATNLGGTSGCGEEHQLQAFEFALVAKGIGNDEQQANFLRRTAQLALIFITDEDDCSAATNDGMFGDSNHPELKNESASLRCATRAHQCGGRNLTDVPPGYPTVESFSAPFSTCAARTDDCPNPTDGDPTKTTDTSVPTSCSPLKSIKHLASEIKSLKRNPDEQILVAGFFGWPLSDQDMATATYKIAPVPNPNVADAAHPTVFDLWPVCYDPNNMPTPSDPYPGWAAAPGLRLAAFVNEFGNNGLKFSICQSDFAASMSQIGASLAKRLQHQCLPASYAQYTNCSAHLLSTEPDPADPADVIFLQGSAVPACDSTTPATPCYTLVPDSTSCETGELLVQVDGGDTLTPGTMLEFQCP